MKNEMQTKLELLTSNLQEIKGGFFWQHTMTKRLAALIYAQEGKVVDYARIEQSHELIKSNTGIFSAFRGNMSLCIAAMLSLKDEREELFERIQNVYEMMKDVKFRSCDYLVAAAFQIATNAKPEEYQQAIDRAKAFYDGMKVNSFFRTGQDDYIFAAMLGLSDIDVKTGTDRIEQLYRHFKPEFWSGNSVQALAQVLVLSGECEAAADRVLALRDALKEQKLRFDKVYTLPTLGVLALLPVEDSKLASDMNEARTFLRAQKGFGALSVSDQELLLYAAAVVASEYASNVKSDMIMASVSVSTTSILIAQQTAMIAASAAAAASASASAN